MGCGASAERVSDLAPPPDTGVVNATAKEPIREIQLGASVFCCSFSPCGENAIACGKDRSMRMWEVSTGKQLLKATDHSGYVLSCAYSPCGELIASCGDDAHTFIYRTPFTSSQEVSPKDRHITKVYCTDFSSDSSSLLTCSTDTHVKVWDMSTLSCKVSFKHQKSVFSCSFARDAQHLAVSAGDDKVIKVWDVRSKKEAHALRGHSLTVWSVRFNSDGTEVISGGMDGVIKIWDVRTQQTIFNLRAETKVHCAKFSEKYGVLSSGRDSCIQLWEPKVGKRKGRVKVHAGQVYCIAEHDGKVISSGADGAVRFWDLDDDDGATLDDIAVDLAGLDDDPWDDTPSPQPESD